MKEQKNWSFGVNVHGVGTLYYGRDYFERKGIVNPVTAAPYSDREIADIINGANSGKDGYLFELPSKAVLGINGYWYDAEGAAAITSHADPLTLGADGTFTTADGRTVAKPLEEQ